MSELLNVVGVEVKAIEEFLDHQFDDYGIEYSVEFDEDNSSDHEKVFIISTDKETPCNDVIMKVKTEDKKVKLYVEIGEDCWYEVEWFEPTVKYFWIAYLHQN